MMSVAANLPNPILEVHEEEYIRLLGYPHAQTMDERAVRLMARTRTRFSRIGRPWVRTRQLDIERTEAECVHLTNGAVLNSTTLAAKLKKAEAHTLMVAAVSAGPQVIEETVRLWRSDRPDEAFFLDVFASAVVEQLTLATGVQLCEWGEPAGLAVLPHYSPGYPGWDLREQAALLDLLQVNGDALPGPLEVLSSGGLKPSKSMLAVFGLTRRADLLERQADLCPCLGCSYSPCAYRRMPQQTQPIPPPSVTPKISKRGSMGPSDQSDRRVVDASAYAYPEKALRRWSSDCLQLDFHENGTITATFRYEGSTCTSMGIPLAFDFVVRIRSSPDGYRIEQTSCRPTVGDQGHESMCAYIDAPEMLMKEVEDFCPLNGHALAKVIEWDPPITMSGCLCSRADQTHKWRVALQTIHYGLMRHDQDAS